MTTQEPKCFRVMVSQCGKLYLYDFRLAADEHGEAGARLLRVELGNAPFRNPTVDAQGNVVFRRQDYTIAEDEMFDAGNNLIVAADRSLILAVGSGLVRVRGTSLVECQ